VRRALAATAVALAATGGALALARRSSPPARPAPALVDVAVARSVGPADVATGVLAGAGRVVTVAHVIERGRRVSVRAGGRWRPARVAALDRRDDLAVLAVAGLRGEPAAFAPGSASGHARMLVRRHGRTASLAATVRRSVRATVLGSTPPGYRRPSLELAAGVDPGDSGAPVVSRDGRVVGIVFARALRDRPAVTYAVDGAMARALLERGGARSRVARDASEEQRGR
jgi:S1-C subfamily serine protease